MEIRPATEKMRNSMKNQTKELNYYGSDGKAVGSDVAIKHCLTGREI